MSVGTIEETASAAQQAAWMDLARIVLEAIAAHVVRWRDADYKQFRDGLTEVVRILKGKPSASSVLDCAVTLAQRIEHYHRETQGFVDGALRELHEVIRILMLSVAQVQVDCADSARELHEIEEMIRSTRTAEELQVAKVHLTDALSRLGELAKQRKEAASELVANLQDRVFVLEQSLGRAPVQCFAAGPTDLSPLPPVPSTQREETARVGIEQTSGPPACHVASTETRLDSATGLPGRESAKAAILALGAEDPANRYVVALYVKRMEVINARFGDRFGDELLCFCAQQIARLLRDSDDQLFRWRGPAFVALLRRNTSLVDVRREVERTCGTRMTFESRSGSVLLPISITTQVAHAASDDCPELIQRVEKFFSLSSTRWG